MLVRVADRYAFSITAEGPDDWRESKGYLARRSEEVNLGIILQLRKRVKSKYGEEAELQIVDKDRN